MGKRGAATPAISDDAISTLRGGQRHAVLRYSRELPMYVIGFELGYLGTGHVRRERVSLEGCFSGQKVGGDGDKAVGSHLICHAPHPCRETEDLVHDENDW